MTAGSEQHERAEGRWHGRVPFVVGLVVALALVVAALVVLDDDEEEVATTGTTTTTLTVATSSTAPTGTADLVWPPRTHDQYTDPVAAARSFLEEYVGFRDPPLSEVRPGPGSTGEVDVHGVAEDGSARRDKVVSTVTLRQAAGGWMVTGARSADVVVDAPKVLDTVGSVFVAEGRSRGFEGTIVVSVVDGGGTAADALGQAVGIAGAAADLAPFRLEVTTDRRPAAASGSLLFATDTGCSGCTAAFAVLPVRFAAASAGGLGTETLRIDGIGPITIGMTLEEATAALGRPVRLDTGGLPGPEDEAECGYAAADGVPEGLRFMLTRSGPTDAWRVNRIDVDRESRITTTEGIGVGATEADVTRAYEGRPGGLAVEPHKYVPGGHYLVHDPDGPDRLLLVFETDGARIVAFHTGRQTEARYVEGCA